MLPPNLPIHFSGKLNIDILTLDENTIIQAELTSKKLFYTKLLSAQEFQAILSADILQKQLSPCYARTYVNFGNCGSRFSLQIPRIA